MLSARYSNILETVTPRGFKIELATIFIISIALQALAMNPSINPYDEGLILVGAQRILAGQLPYRDFWTMYAPGQFYVVAALFKIFGEHALIGRIYEFLVRGAILALCFVLMRPFVTRRVNWAATGAICILMISNSSYIFPIFPALVFTLAAAICVASYVFRSQMVMAFCAGLLAGLSAVFRHDVGFSTSIACGIGIALVHLLGEVNMPLSRRVNAALRANMALAGGALTIVAPVVCLLVWSVPLQDLYQNLISIPFFVYPKVRSLPFPPFIDYLELGLTGKLAFLRGLVVYVPVIAVLVAIIFVILCSLNLRERNYSKATIFSLFLIILTVMLFIKGIVRVSPEHLILAEVSAILLVASLTKLNLFQRTAGKILFSSSLIVMTLSLFAFLEEAIAQVMSNLGPNGLVHICRYSELPKLRCMETSPDDVTIVRMIDRMTDAKERIYVGAGRHDTLFANNISIYFLASRLPATKWHDLHPGVETTLSIQQEMIADLEINHPNLIIIDPTYDQAKEPNASMESSGVRILDEYIAQHYKEIFRGNPKRLLERQPKL